MIRTLLLLAVPALFLTACGAPDTPAGDAPNTDVDQADANARKVTTLTLETAPFDHFFTVQGNVETDRMARLFPMTQGKHIGGTQAGALMLVALFELLASRQLRLGAYVWGPGEGFMGAVVREREKYPYLDEKYVTPLLAGEKTSAFGFTEPPDAPRTSATLDSAARTLTSGTSSKSRW